MARDSITILRARLADYHQEDVMLGISSSHGFALARANLASAFAADGAALLDELEQLRGVVAKANQIEIDDDISIDNRNIGSVIYYGPYHIHGIGKDVVPFGSMLSALAFLRSDAGKIAVEAARKATQ